MARPKDLTDRALIERLQSLLINAAEGQRSIADDRDYPLLRREVGKRSLPTPSLVATHPTVDSVMALFKTMPKVSRCSEVYRDFAEVLEYVADETSGTNASDWTGSSSGKALLESARQLLPVTRLGIEALIESLSEPPPNGGPILDERKAAIRHLRELNRCLTEIIAAVDADRLEEVHGQGLVAEAVDYAKRATDDLRGDPIPYAGSLMVLCVFEALGFSGISGYLAGAMLGIRKR